MFEPLLIDNIEFARQDGRLAGRIEIAALPRLHDALAATAGQVEYSLAGHIGRQGKPTLECEVSGVLTLVCQRCLEPLVWPVALRNGLEIGPSDAADGETALDEAPDRIDADAHMDVHALIEDELLLALPLAPMHAAGECRMRNPDGEAAPGSSLTKLAELMRQQKG